MAYQLSKQQPVNAAVVFGGINMDIWGRPKAPLVQKDSNPGAVTMRPGGVGRNIAHDLRLLGLEVSLVAPIGGDVYASAVVDSCQALGIDLSMAPVFKDMRSSTYLYITDETGDMELAISDMELCSALTPELVAPILPRLRASAVVVDANLPAETIAYICGNSPRPVYADPVSTVKAMKLQPVLHHLAAIKPNALEAQCLTGESDPERAALALVERGVRRVFISLGAQGMIAADEKQLLRLPVLPTRVINATGAGDAATAAIVLAGIRGMGLEETALLAQKAGAVTCCSESANAPELAGILTQIHFDG